MKNFIICVLAVLFLASCGGKQESKTSDKKNPTNETHTKIDFGKCHADGNLNHLVIECDENIEDISYTNKNINLSGSININGSTAKKIDNKRIELDKIDKLLEFFKSDFSIVLSHKSSASVIELRGNVLQAGQSQKINKQEPEQDIQQEIPKPEIAGPCVLTTTLAYKTHSNFEISCSEEIISIKIQSSLSGKSRSSFDDLSYDGFTLRRKNKTSFTGSFNLKNLITGSTGSSLILSGYNSDVTFLFYVK